jgi:hypothetical protein
MPVDAIIHLDHLRCLAEWDDHGHSEPYVWTLLIWLDDTTIGSGQFVGSIAPGNVQGSRTVIKEGMKAGERAPMPSVQKAFSHRFEDDLNFRFIGIVVAMFEQDDTPLDAVRAGYDAFVRELPRALADFMRINRRPPDEEERKDIANKVGPKIFVAFWDALSAYEKLQVFLGKLNLDDLIGNDTFFTEIDSNETAVSRFTLKFENTIALDTKEEVTNHYELDGRFELREPPPPDPCQAEIDRVKQARTRIDSIQADIRRLGDELHEAPPTEKPEINKEIRRIRDEVLPAAVATLEAAQRALALCRALNPEPPSPPNHVDKTA